MPATFFSRFASVSALLVVAACGGAAAQPAASEPTKLTSASADHASRPAAVLAPRMVNGSGRPDADVAPIVKAALAKKLDAAPDAKLTLVPVLEPATALGGDLSLSVRLEVHRANGELVASIRKTVGKPGAKPGDRAAEDELLARAVEDAAADFAAHAGDFGP